MTTFLYVLLSITFISTSFIIPVNAQVRSGKQATESGKTKIRRDMPDPASMKATIMEKMCNVQGMQQKEKNVINQLDRFIEKTSSYSASLQDYYITKLVPQGKTIPDYASRSADIAAKKAALPGIKEDILSDINDLTCEPGSRGGKMATLQKDFRLYKKAVTDYIQSVNQLYREIRKISGKSQINEATDSAKKIFKHMRSPLPFNKYVQ